MKIFGFFLLCFVFGLNLVWAETQPPEDLDQLFAPQAETVDSHRLRLSWQIAEGYFLFRSKFVVESQTAGITLEPINFPEGEIEKSEFFGDQMVYRRQLTLDIPLRRATAEKNLQLKIVLQGCRSMSDCFPQHIQTVTLNLPPIQEIAPQTSLTKPDLRALLTSPNKSAASLGGNGDFLEASQAFLFSAEIRETTIVAYWQIAEGYYLYRHRLKFDLEGATLGEAQIPTGKFKDDPEYGKVEVYYQQLTVTLPFTAPQSDSLTLYIEYQGCAEAGLCYPPIQEKINLSCAQPGILTRPQPELAPSDQLSEQDRLARLLAEGNLLWMSLTFFGLGILLALTPCVFPMIPILSGIIAGQNKNLTPRKAFILSLTYVLAMAITYAAAGVIAGLVGANLQLALQKPWIATAFAAVFVLLSLAMFGFYELQLPVSWQNKLNALSHRQSGGTLIGVAAMGILSALIVSPCVAAPLAGALIYIGKSGDPVTGGAALFALSLGMGTPLLLIGASLGKLLPKAGRWMSIIKDIFGVLMLAVAAWIVEWTLPAPVSLVLWAALLIIPAVYMGALDSLPYTASGWQRLWKGIGFMMLLWGVLLIIGAAQGGKDLLQPLVFHATDKQMRASSALPFKRIKSLADLENELASASAANKTVMLDFYADWCVACKEMERFTFADSSVQHALAETILLQADVTAYDEQDKALLQYFELPGPPATLFFGADGKERRDYRVIGFLAAAEFRARVEEFKE